MIWISFILGFIVGFFGCIAFAIIIILLGKREYELTEDELNKTDIEL